MVNIEFAKFCIALLQSADRVVYSVTQDRSRVVQRMRINCRSSVKQFTLDDKPQSIVGAAPTTEATDAKFHPAFGTRRRGFSLVGGGRLPGCGCCACDLHTTACLVPEQYL
jgi:hypothetical protein